MYPNTQFSKLITSTRTTIAPLISAQKFYEAKKLVLKTAGDWTKSQNASDNLVLRALFPHIGLALLKKDWSADDIDNLLINEESLNLSPNDKIIIRNNIWWFYHTQRMQEKHHICSILAVLHRGYKLIISDFSSEALKFANRLPHEYRKYYSYLSHEADHTQTPIIAAYNQR